MTTSDASPEPWSTTARPDARVTKVRRMGLHDLPFVVAAHREHFPDGFFVSLGPRFLTRYYRTFLDAGPLTVALVVEVDGDPCGYLTGVLAGSTHRSVMLKYHGLALVAAAAVGMAIRPRVALKFVVTRASRYTRALTRHRSAVGRQPAPAGSPAVLSHVVVVEPERLAGIGSCLVRAFLDEADAAGCRSAQLVTEAGSKGAGPFYESLGWRLAGEASVDGRALLKYEISVGEVLRDA
jgi:GNAT superfamily N-acetyltransferase